VKLEGGVLHVGAAEVAEADVVLVAELVVREDVVLVIKFVVVEYTGLDVELAETVDDAEVELTFVVALTG